MCNIATSIVLGLFHSEGTCIITLNPDGVRRIVALAMDHDMLISAKRIAGLASIIERCGDEIRLSTLKRWEETLKEGSRSIQQDAFVRNTSIYLRGNVFELGNI